MEIKKSSGKSDFQANAKKYVINMVRGSKRTMHIKNEKSCSWSSFLQEYVDFDSLEEAEASGIAYVECKNCFKEK